MSAIIDQCVITLPWPDSALFVNRSNGRHWTARQPAKHAARLLALCEAQARNISIDIGDTSHDHAVTIILEPPDNRRRDVDGVLAALKPSLDGIAQAIGIDDYHFNPVTIVRREPVSAGRVTVRIETIGLQILTGSILTKHDENSNQNCLTNIIQL